MKSFILILIHAILKNGPLEIQIAHEGFGPRIVSGKALEFLFRYRETFCVQGEIMGRCQLKI